MKKLLLIALMLLGCSLAHTQTTNCESFKAKKQHWALNQAAEDAKRSKWNPKNWF